MPDNSAPSTRTRLVRKPQRAVYDRTAIDTILDEAFICHVGFVVDGQPFVIPTGFGRRGDHLYIHGSAASRMLRNLDQGIAVCVTVTLLDGLVLARSIFNHSMNYRRSSCWAPLSQSKILMRNWKLFGCYPSTSSRPMGRVEIPQRKRIEGDHCPASSSDRMLGKGPHGTAN